MLQYGYEIRDVYSNSAACAPAEANTWTAQRARTSPIWYTCAGYILTGGYGKLGDASNAYQDYYWKDYSGLYTHNFIYFTMTLWILDSWSFDMTAGDYDDTFRIEFDGVTLSGDTWNTHNFYYDYCGDARYKDLPHVRVFGRVAHTGPTLRIRVVNLCDEESTNESLAFREINLLFAANAPASTPSDMCVRSIVQPRAAVPSAVCPCSEGYWSNSGVCTPCHSSCASCFGAGNSLCYQCKVGYSWTGGGCSQCFSNCAACIASGEANCVLCMTGYRLAAGRCVPDCPDLLVKYTDGNCIDRCTSSCGGNYIYWDGSCNSTCITPLQQDRLIRSVPHCVYPCDPTDYLYWDGTCLQDCEEPLLASVYLGKNFCNYPCAPAAEYLYWNGTCLASCLPPFVVSTSHGRLFCEFKCNVGAYLYWDGRCSAECKFPLTARITDGNLYCDYPCEYNAYLYWDGSCEQSCAPLLTPSTTGTIRPRNYCDYPGDNTTYLYWNSSLLPVCDPPFETRIFKGMKYCENPCPASYYIHWNISCMSTCPTPGVIRQQAGLLYCDFPCKEDEFYYWDGTCVKNCPDPYIPSVIGGIAPRKICDFECLAPYFSYWNGSCLSSCDPPNTFKVAHGRQFCHFACERTEFYYYNDTCRPNCPLPFIPRQEAGIEYCDHPCLGSGYITQWNYTCIANCDLPYRKLNNPFSMDWCRLPCDDAQAFINITTGLCSETCEGTAEKQDDLYFICIPHPPLPPPQGLLDLLLTAEADFRDPSFISLNKLTYPIRYVDIYLPPRLEKLLQSKARNIASWNIEVSRPDKLVASFPGKPMVKVYQSSSLTSSFILNFWPNLMFLGVAILSGLMFQMLTKVFEIMEWDHFYWIFQKLSVICTWNFLLVLMGYYADDLAFFMCLDIQYNHVDNLLGNVSLFVALAVFTVFMLYLLLMLYIMQRVQMIQKIVDRGERTEEYEKFCQGWRWCLAFYRPFNSQDWKQQIFYLIYILRLVSVILVTALGHQYPLLQTSFQAGANVFILGYILLFNPLKRTANTVQILCYEVGAATSNICFWLLMLIHLNPTRFYNWAMIVYLGDMIILANVYLNIAAPIFLIVKAVIEIEYIYRRLRYDSSVDRAAWVRLVVILIQQGAFGFEELLEPAPLVIRTRKMKLPQPNRQIFPAENSTNVGYRGNETTRFFIEGEEGERTTVEPTINYGRRPRNMKFEYDSRMDDPFVWRMYDTDTPGFDQSREEEIISGPIVPVMREDPEDRAETLSIPDDNQNNSGFFGNTQSTSFFKGLYHLEGIVPVNNNTNNNFNRRNLESIAEEQESPHIDPKIYF